MHYCVCVCGHPIVFPVSSPAHAGEVAESGSQDCSRSSTCLLPALCEPWILFRRSSVFTELHDFRIFPYYHKVRKPPFTTIQQYSTVVLLTCQGGKSRSNGWPPPPPHSCSQQYHSTVVQQYSTVFNSSTSKRPVQETIPSVKPATP